MPLLVKCTHSRWIFKLDFLKDSALFEKKLLHNYDLLLHKDLHIYCCSLPVSS